MNDPTPARPATHSPERASEALAGVPAAQGAREALVEQMAEAFVGWQVGGNGYDWASVDSHTSRAMARAVLPHVAAQVEAAVSVVRAEAEQFELERDEARTARNRWRDEVDYAAAGASIMTRRQMWADFAATLNDRADMWEADGQGRLAQESRGLANACRTYAEGVGVPSMQTLRQKRDEARAERDALREKVARVEALRDQWKGESSKTAVGMTYLGCGGLLDAALSDPTTPDQEGDA